ncbi:MAG: PIG-L family deacetylase [Verrucomicrobia bacterium]|nr:PIG-L family deacetylase [Verrucomicrobiota bacterium]
MNVLVVAPHPDDETLGCGGTLCRHAAGGDRVVVVFLTSGELGLKHLPRERAWAIREREASAAARVLGVAAVEFLRQPDWGVGGHGAAAARGLRPVLERERPRLVYVPHRKEWHPDHRAALPVLRAALRGGALGAPEVRAYEVWTPMARHDHVEDITAVMPRKLRALRAHRSQLGEFDYARAVRGLNQFRGELAARCRYAEVFAAVSIQTVP